MAKLRVESILVNKLRRSLKELNVDSVKLHGNMYQHAGLPDVLLSSGGELALMEVKRLRGKLTKRQINTLYRFKPSLVVRIEEGYEITISIVTSQKGEMKDVRCHTDSSALDKTAAAVCDLLFHSDDCHD